MQFLKPFILLFFINMQATGIFYEAGNFLIKAFTNIPKPSFKMSLVFMGCTYGFITLTEQIIKKVFPRFDSTRELKKRLLKISHAHDQLLQEKAKTHYYIQFLHNSIDDLENSFTMIQQENNEYTKTHTTLADKYHKNKMRKNELTAELQQKSALLYTYLSNEKKINVLETKINSFETLAESLIQTIHTNTHNIQTLQEQLVLTQNHQQALSHLLVKNREEID
jgi:chromosome segregation ATPase